MWASGRSGMAWAVAAALAVGSPGGPAVAQPQAAAEDAGVCVAVSGGEHAAVAEAARRALGEPSERVDVRERGRRETLAAHCTRLVIAVGPEALRVATESAPRVPIVHVMVPDPSGRDRPGVAPGPDPRSVLETLRVLAPRARRVGAVYDPELTGALVAEGRAVARELGMELVALPVRSVGEAVRAFHRFEKDLAVDALWLLPDGTATVQETVYYALEIAHWRRIGVIGLSRWYVASGALFALLPTPEGYGAAAAELGRQILRGGPTPAAAHPRDPLLYLNERTATRLGLVVPRRLLETAERVLP